MVEECCDYRVSAIKEESEESKEEDRAIESGVKEENLEIEQF